MLERYNRRNFIISGSAILLLLPFIQYCKSKSKNTAGDKIKEKQVLRHVTKKRKPPVNMKMVSNRGWYKNKKNGKIHFFDDRGFAPSLQYLKNTKEFEMFIKHLEPWDAKQLTLEIFQKNVSKKNKDWITENAALAFTSFGNYTDAAEIVKSRIEKRPFNVRMWDMFCIITLQSANEKLKGDQQLLITKYRNTTNKQLLQRLARYDETAWQTKIKDKDFKWDNRKI